MEGQPKRGRGRPRKYPPKTAGDFETTKYDVFFTSNNRGPEEGLTIDMNEVVKEVFDFLYKGQYATKLFSHPQSYQEHPILNNLVADNAPSSKPKNEKTCDEVFYEYLYNFKSKTNKKYLSLLIKFDLCNEFYGEFMEPNNFFGIEDQDEKNEIIEIIQHFCIWLFKNEYTKSKLSLAS